MKKILIIAALILSFTASAWGFEFVQTGRFIEDSGGFSKVEINGNFFGVDNPMDLVLVKGQYVVVVFTVD